MASARYLEVEKGEDGRKRQHYKNNQYGQLATQTEFGFNTHQVPPQEEYGNKRPAHGLST